MWTVLLDGVLQFLYRIYSLLLILFLCYDSFCCPSEADKQTVESVNFEIFNYCFRIESNMLICPTVITAVDVNVLVM